jgi:hypothetical protein
MYQVELTRCFRQNLLDLVVIGYQQEDQGTSAEQPLVEFAAQLNHPLVIVGPDAPNQFVLNHAAQSWLDELQLPADSWQVLDGTIPVQRVGEARLVWSWPVICKEKRMEQTFVPCA